MVPVCDVVSSIYFVLNGHLSTLPCESFCKTKRISVSEINCENKYSLLSLGSFRVLKVASLVILSFFITKNCSYHFWIIRDCPDIAVDFSLYFSSTFNSMIL